jgi:TonB family protein
VWPQVNNRALRRLRGAAAAALAVHGLLIGVFALTRPAAGPGVVGEEIPIEALDEAEARKLFDQLVPLPQINEPPEPVRHIVVDQKNDGQTPTEPTRYVAEADSNPERETRRALAPEKVVRTEQPSPRPQAGSSPRRGTAGSVLEPPPFVEPVRSAAAPERGQAGGPGLPEEATADGTLRRGGSAVTSSAGGGGAPASPTATAPTTLAMAPAPMVTVDKDSVDDLDLALAEDGAVRARHSAHAAYLNEVRRKVAECWHPLDAWKSADPRLTRLSDSRLRETVLRARLRPDGSLASLDMPTSSGIPGLDEAALSAFRQAQPFSPPPRELLDDGKVFTVQSFRFAMDNSASAYLTDLTRVVRDTWHPSPAFRAFIPGDRMTVVDLRLNYDGVVDSASVLQSSGFDYLDASALTSVKKGTQFPRPPAELPMDAGLVPVRVIFMHRARKPAEVIIPR